MKHYNFSLTIALFFVSSSFCGTDRDNSLTIFTKHTDLTKYWLVKELTNQYDDQDFLHKKINATIIALQLKKSKMKDIFCLHPISFTYPDRHFTHQLPSIKPLDIFLPYPNYLIRGIYHAQGDSEGIANPIKETLSNDFSDIPDSCRVIPRSAIFDYDPENLSLDSYPNDPTVIQARCYDYMLEQAKKLKNADEHAVLKRIEAIRAIMEFIEENNMDDID